MRISDWSSDVCSSDLRARIAALFDDGDTSTFAALDALRTVPSKRMPTELFRHLDRLAAVRAINLRPSPPRGVPATTLDRPARVARVSPHSHITALTRLRRHLTVPAPHVTCRVTAYHATLAQSPILFVLLLAA